MGSSERAARSQRRLDGAWNLSVFILLNDNVTYFLLLGEGLHVFSQSNPFHDLHSAMCVFMEFSLSDLPPVTSAVLLCL